MEAFKYSFYEQHDNILAFYRDQVSCGAKAKGGTTFLLAPGVGENGKRRETGLGIEVCYHGPAMMVRYRQ